MMLSAKEVGVKRGKGDFQEKKKRREGARRNRHFPLLHLRNSRPIRTRIRGRKKKKKEVIGEKRKKEKRKRAE